MAPSESQYTFKYITSAVQMECLSLVVYEIFEKNAHLIFDLECQSKFMAPYESSHMVLYMLIIQMEPLSSIVYEIFDF